MKRVSVEYINHSRLVNMLLHRRGKLWLGSAVRYKRLFPKDEIRSVGPILLLDNGH